jgi:hypothetical protein
MADKLVHGTHNRGVRHGMAKLDNALVLEIRGQRGVASQASLGRMYGVTRETIRDIQKRKIWAWLSEEEAA